MKIQAAIFDMDGLLIDSEPYWKMAEKKVFGQLGLNLTDELLRQVMGFRLSEVVAHWYSYKPWPNPDFIKTEAEVLSSVKELISNHADQMPGVYESLTQCKQAGLSIAIASSSAMSLIETVVNKLALRQYFDELVSADTEPYGKPHPGIFITAAAKLGVSPSACLVFEDSLNGLIAAKAARMKCVVIPEELKRNELYWSLADYKLNSLAEFTSNLIQIA
jgi:sugar-phosphatase